MSPLTNRKGSPWKLQRRQRPRWQPRLEGLEDRTVLSALAVTNNLDSGEGSLRAAIATANANPDPDNTITFDPSLTDQTITLTSGELVITNEKPLITKRLNITGLGADNLTISGGDKVRVFDIKGSGVTVTIAGLTIAHGTAQGGDGEAGRGGGILMESGTALNLTSSTLDHNQARGGTNAPGEGGAIYMENGTTLAVVDSLLSNNTAQGGVARSGGGGVPGVRNHGGGGGVNSVGGHLTITRSTLRDNRALGGGGGFFGGFGVGGGINSEAGATLELTSGSELTGNQARGGDGLLVDGSGYGGALFNLNAALIMTAGPTPTPTPITVTGNQAGSDTNFGLGGGLFSLGGSVSLNDASITGNAASIPLFNDVFILFSRRTAPGLL